MPLTLAIVGRPNVGKSTLFNRLAGKRLAIVHDQPGVTRDRSYADANLNGLELKLIDTAGFELGARESMQARMMEQTRAAIAEAEICLFLIDAREGVTPGDEIIADALRRSGKPVIVAANKCEGQSGVAGHSEAYRLGFGDPIALSAEHGQGLGELFEALQPFAPQHEPAGEDEGEDGDIDEDAEDAVTEEEDQGPRPLRLAIVGRPNVGKSSLFNRIIGQERSLTGPEAGITRDAIAVSWKWGEREVLLHDTAGLRRKARIEEAVEKLSVESTLNAVRFADCVVLVIDAERPFETQDLSIADLIAREGRAVVFAINKWDLVKDKQGAMKDLKERLARLLPQLEGAEMIGLSALTGAGLDNLMPAIEKTDRIWNMRVPTAQLNRFLGETLQHHPPPAIHGRRVKIRYMTQTKARPPTFVLFGTQLKAIPDSYLRYLIHGIRETFGIVGVPIRFTLREPKNPFAEKA